MESSLGSARLEKAAVRRLGGKAAMGVHVWVLRAMGSEVVSTGDFSSVD